MDLNKFIFRGANIGLFYGIKKLIKQGFQQGADYFLSFFAEKPCSDVK
jgi:hypothetical protein